VEAEVPKPYAPEFRRKVLDLVASGGRQRKSRTTWRSARRRFTTGGGSSRSAAASCRGITRSNDAELVAACKRVAKQEDELAIHRKAAEQLGNVVSHKTV
jgi:hypothetical protein